MKKIFLLIALIFLFAGCAKAINTGIQGQDNQPIQRLNTFDYKYENFAIYLNYPRDYQIGSIWNPDSNGKDKNLLETVSFVPEGIFDNTPAVDVGGPPGITFSVFKNQKKLNAFEWAKLYPQSSYFYEQKNGFNKMKINGQDSVIYVIEGLYNIKIYIFTKNEYAILFKGDYNNKKDELEVTFDNFVNSIKF